MLLWRRVKALALAGGGRLLWLAIAVLLLSALLGPALREAIRRGWSGLTATVYHTHPSPTVIVSHLQRLNRLETARQITNHIIEVEASNGLPVWLAGERVLLIARAEAVAGIDFAELKPEQIQVEGKRVRLQLPPPRLLHVSLNEAHTKVYDRKRGWLVFQPDKEIETRARQQAIEEAREAALKGELMELAQRNAQERLTELLRSLGFEEVEVEFQR
ncbi:MAG: DUF4230 domain-containing protein [Armatimonadetes bacterium]|nr:DUF4230 domain-containing protein [Armatimonadota bacterium]CUU36972.1 Protein of unknown function (DUF4230) [Armatimonadetes bacterium DC]